MASNYHLALLFFFFLAHSTFLSPCTATTRKLTALVQDPPLVLKYHKGPLLKGNVTVNIVWYGNFSPKQRSILVDFLHSLSSRPSQHSVASWWQTTARYTGGPCTVAVGNQFLDNTYSLGKTLTDAKLAALAKLGSKRRRNSKSVTTIDVILTGADVAISGFCMSRCGSHGSGRGGSAYMWVGNPVTQCPGQCAWPFYRPIYGPQSPPLVSPNGDVGIDGMVINLATVLAGTVTNPFGNGYFQGEGGYEAVSACTGIFGNGAYPGYPGEVVMEKTTGASYNAVGLRGRKYLLPAMWDPKTSVCKTVG